VFLKFIVVGTLNTAFSYGLYVFLVSVGLHYSVANLVALVAGILFGFKTQGVLVFKSYNNRLLLRFVAVWGFIYVIGLAVIGAMMHMGFNAYLAGAASLPFTAVLSYLCQRHFVFRDALAGKALKRADS